MSPGDSDIAQDPNHGPRTAVFSKEGTDPRAFGPGWEPGVWWFLLRHTGQGSGERFQGDELHLGCVRCPVHYMYVHIGFGAEGDICL